MAQTSRTIIGPPSPTLRDVAAVGLQRVDECDDQLAALAAADVATAIEHRIEGLLSVALETGHVSASDEASAAVTAAHNQALRRCLMVEDATAAAQDAMARAGVETRVLKGIASAHLDYTDPAERIFADADVLIRRGDLRAALVALDRAGFRRLEPPVRPSWEPRFGKAIVLRAPQRTLLDLHLSITGGFFGARIPHDELWDAPYEQFELAGLELRALSLPHRFIHACCHTVLGGASGLRAMRDVAELATAPRLEIGAVVDDVARWGIDLVVARAVTAAWRELSLSHESPMYAWAAAHDGEPEQRRALGGYAAARDHGWGPEGMTTLRALSPLDRVRFVAGLAVPTRESLRGRRRTRRSHVAAMFRSVRPRPTPST